MAKEKKQQNEELAKKFCEENGFTMLHFEPNKIKAFMNGSITFAQMANISPKQQFEMANIGHKLLQQGKVDKARAMFRSLVSMNPREAYFRLALASVEHKSGHYKIAEFMYTACLARDRGNITALIYRGECRLMQGKIKRALGDFQTAINADPECKNPAIGRVAIIVKSLNENLKKGNKKKKVDDNKKK